MRLYLRAVLILILALAPHAAGASEVAMSVARIAPRSAALALGQPFHVEIAYRSDIPLRLQAEGYSTGKPLNAGQSMNASVAHPAGSGKTLVWISYRESAAIDEIRITAYDSSWQPLRALAVPMRIQWSKDGARFENPSWIDDLRAVEARIDEAARAASEAKSGGIGDVILDIALWFALPGFLVLQVLAFRWLSGGWRLAAMLPAGLMGLAVIHAMLALASGSNLWPILIILGVPPAFLWLAALLLLRGVTRRFA
jgi:hypothetical protein